MKKYKLIFYVLAIIFFAFNTNNIVKAENVNTYDGTLGIEYTTSGTSFSVWSSSAESIKVSIEGLEDVELTWSSSSNVWKAYVGGDLINKEYSYTVEYSGGEIYENVLDPYGKFLNKTADKNIIYDGGLVGFTEWYEQEGNIITSDREKIIYGLNIKNYTSDVTWDGAAVNKGKLLSLIEDGTKYSGVATGFDYIKNLGVTHVELVDLLDSTNKFAVNSSLVSGEYSYSGNSELKNVVNKYYQAGMGIIINLNLDEFSPKFLTNLNKLDKNYYLKQDSTLNIDQYMVQKYIKDLATYWIKEYKLAGLNFESMNVIDINIINEIYNDLEETYPDLILYGNGSYSVSNGSKATENNLSKMENISMFNNSLNYSLFGNLNDATLKGLLAGNYSEEIVETLKFAFLSTVDNGLIDYSLVQGVSYKGDWNNKKSYQLINNLGLRTGLSLYDKLYLSGIESDRIIKEKMILALGTLVSSGGIPYIQAGEEFLMSYKDATNNSESNAICDSDSTFCFYTDESKKTIDWSRAYKFNDIINAFKSLVNFRNSSDSVVQSDRNTIKDTVRFYSNEEYPGVLGFTRTYIGVRVDQVEKISVLFNYSSNNYKVADLEGKGWRGLYNYNDSIRDGDEVDMKMNSIFMEVRIKQRKVSQWITLIFVVGIIGAVYGVNLLLSRKLVEKGHDIKDIKRKYRPFIKNNQGVEGKENEDENNQETPIGESQEENKKEQ